MASRTVLISGAGIGGLTLAYWLARRGFRPTIVERAGSIRSSGSPVDVRGSAVRVASMMDVMPHIRGAGTAVSDLVFVNATGKRVGRINMRALQDASGSGEAELPRGDLASILYEAARDYAEFIFDDTIAAMEPDAHGIDVTFEKGLPRRFDLVIGADGLHSNVRHLAFGPDAQFVRHLGLYIATVALGSVVANEKEVVVYNVPGRALSLHPSTGRAIAAFLFHAPAYPNFDYRDTQAHKRILETIFTDDGWRTPEFMSKMRVADELYFDSVSQVRLAQWQRGRVALLGDAASCVSLFGEGSTLAMTGAFTLAEELAASPDDHEAAYRRYEARHRVLVDSKQRNIRSSAALLVPKTRTGIIARNLATRLWPIGAVAARLGRLVTPRAEFA